MFWIDLFDGIINEIGKYSGEIYVGKGEYGYKNPMRIIADHLKAATFLITEGVLPSNKLHGYILRRLLRRAMVKMQQLKGNVTSAVEDISYIAVADQVINTYKDSFPNLTSKRDLILNTIKEERDRFGATLERGLKIINNYSDVQLNELNAFTLYQSYGFPYEVTEEIFLKRGKKLDKRIFENAFKSHKICQKTFSRSF
jgi:alanyl-tRNA synthetase